MLRLCLLWRSTFRDSKLAERMQVVAKNVIELDHLAVDVSSMVGNALRMTKNESRRSRDAARYVSQGLHTLLSRFQPAKSVALFFDGSEVMWKARKLRESQNKTKRVGSRMMRLPGSQVMQAVEEKVVRMLPDPNLFPPNVVCCGTCVPGSVEQKMTAWALDLASVPSTKASENIALLGSSELFLNTLALTPFFNVSSLVQHNSDMKQLSLQDVLEWLTVDGIAKAGEVSLAAKVRTDVLFLYMICNGYGATELSGISGLAFTEVLSKYLGGEGAPDGPRPRKCLFSEEENGSLALSVPNFLELIEKVAPALSTEVKKVEQYPAAKTFFNMALLSHQMVCQGVVKDWLFCPFSLEAPSLKDVFSYLKSLSDHGTESLEAPSSENEQPLCAAEYTLLSTPGYDIDEFSNLVSFYVGFPPKQDFVRQFLNYSVDRARETIQRVLAFTPPGKLHKCAHISPSYHWKQNPRNKLWSFEYVDVGRKSEKEGTRRKLNITEGRAIDFAVSQDGPVQFIKGHWEPIPSFPMPVPDHPVPDSIKIVTWNVMFDRYSGQPTPLGMPGIDWCSGKRYPVLSKVLSETDADVIGMQEVEPQFWEILSKEPWVQNNYILSCNVSAAAINPWGVLMMVHKRMRVNNITHLNIPAFSGHICLMPVVNVAMVHGSVHVASMHLLAPFTKTHENVRSSQDATLRQRMQKAISGDCITMGDFNDWPGSEFTMPPESQFVDSWVVANPQNSGFTMDESNTFCKLKIEEQFFGRSDKLFLRSRKLKPVEGKLIGTRSVNAENRNAAAPEYLFPSDHYGVQMTFSVN